VEIDEVIARLTRRYWHVLLIAILAPLIAVGVLANRQPAHYTAQARVAVAADVPKSAAESAALVSQVHALATSRDVVARALSAAHIADRDAQAIADKEIAVTGNGTSAIVTVAVTDADPAAAQAIAANLADGVTSAFDESRIGNLPSVISDVDKQLNDLATRRAPVAAAVSKITSHNPQDSRLPLLQSQLAGIDTLISDLSSDRNRLAEELAAAGNASVVSSPEQPTKADAKGVGQKMALGGLLGLIVGLIIAALAETVRPTVSGASRLGRLLSVPLLGRLDANPAVLQALGRRVRLAARRSGVSQIVVTSASGRPVPEWVIDRLGSVVLEPLGSFPAVQVEEPVLSEVVRQNGARGAMTPAQTPAPTPAGAAQSSQSLGASQSPEIYEVGTLDELTMAGESGPVGILVLAGSTTNANAVHDIRDLLDASGWPLLGVVGHARFGNRR
jgi:capsular polysaccharide biosynthesis protein